MDAVGMVGLGLMGAPMAERFLSAGRTVRVTNRTRSKADALVKNGAVWCATPRAVAEGVTVVHSMVSTPEALEAISVGADGICSGLSRGGVHVDHSTVSPVLTERLEAMYRANGKAFLHAPVLGSVSQVKEGTLLLFVGGEESAYRQAGDSIGLLGQRVWRFGTAAEATNTKLICNSFIAGMIVVLSQGLALANRVGVDPKTLLEIISHSQLNAPMYQSKGAAMIERNFTPRFFVEHLLKDVNLVLDVARSAGVPAPGLEVVRDLYAKAVAMGLAHADYSAVVQTLDARWRAS
jgi:3-hydroxyisobutyrate dehydrogenase